MRGLDMADLGKIFDGQHVTLIDDREDYGEAQSIIVRRLSGRMVVIIWTQRGDTYRIISLRRTNERE